MVSSQTIALAGAAGAALAWYVWTERAKRARWPPLAKTTMWDTYKGMMKNTDELPAFLTKSVRENGPIFRVNVPGPAMIVVLGDAALAKEFLESDLGDRSPMTKEYTGFSGGFMNILVYDTADPHWAVSRKGLAPSFSLSNMNKLQGTILAQVGGLEHVLDEHIGRGELVDGSEVFIRMTMDVLLAMYGIQGESQTGTGLGNKLLDDLHVMIDEVQGKRVYNPLRKYCTFIPSVREANKVIKGFHDQGRAILEKYRATHTVEEMAKDTSIIGNMCRTNYPSDDHRIADLVLLILGGHDTTGGTIAWIMCELGKRPDILAKMRADLDAANPTRGDFTPQMLDSLNYASWVVLEGFRLHPVAPAVVRNVTRDCEIGGYAVPKGAQVLPALCAIVRGVPDGDAFVPERYDPTNPEYKATMRQTEGVPFGLGKRKCAGMNLALRQTKLIVATMVQRFEWELRSEVVPKMGITLIPSNCLFSVKRRP